MEPNIGAAGAFIGQLSWQIKHEWTKQRSLEEWHKRHPDCTDDDFESCYEIAGRCNKMVALLNDPFCTGTLRDLWMSTKSTLPPK
jgi:hypothetical protein